jgi:hypothetical protein
MFVSDFFLIMQFTFHVMETLTKNKQFVFIAISATFVTLMISSSVTLQAQSATMEFKETNFHNPLKIDNKYFPLEPGTTMIYNGTSEDGEPTRDVFVVTNDTKEILGISTRVVHDDAYVKDEHEETTDDWFAQDDQGNVWYMGEYTTDLTKEGSHEGSWEAGMKGTTAGIVMEAQPKVGDSYDQELAKDVAEDKGTVLSLNEKVCVPYGCFSNVLKTEDINPLEPDIVENKYYAQNIGEIKAIMVKGGSEVETLVQINGTGKNNTGLLPVNETTTAAQE